MKSRISILNDDNFIEMQRLIDHKYHFGATLSPFELDFFCNSTIKPSYLKHFEICDEYRFRHLYFTFLYVKEHGYSQARADGHFLNSEDEKDLKQFTEEWLKVINKENHTSQLLQNISKETRKEINLMSQEFKYNGYLVKSNLYKSKLKKILLLSRFIHFKIAFDFFLGYAPREIIIPSIYGDITFDETSMCHILFRHYAAGERTYSPSQSFFSPDVMISSLHKLIIIVLTWIKKLNIDIKKPFNLPISFKFKSVYYELHISQVFIQKKGYKGNIQVNKVKSLFPLNNAYRISLLENQIGYNASNSLTIFDQP